jgi:protein gp37
MARMREADVRAVLTERISANQLPGDGSRIVHELALCQAEARIDVAEVNGSLTGWEIKTAADTLTRLPKQQEVYSRIFDRVWLVADARHIDLALTFIPEWWGVMRINEVAGACRLTKVRASRLNRAVDLHSLVRLLWRTEALDELDALGLADDLRRAPRRVLWHTLAEAAPGRISRTRLQSRVRTRLKDREGWRAE